MNHITNLIKKSKYPVILTGDFNMTLAMPRFILFIDNLESIETLRSIDVVDLNDLKNEHLWEDINKYGRILYQ